jgi:hypothetical protein
VASTTATATATTTIWTTRNLPALTYSFTSPVTILHTIPWTITVTSGASYDYSSWANQPRLSQAEITAIEARHRREAEARRARLQVADARAHQLLLSVLTGNEARSYIERGFFELRGSAGGWWRINRDGQAGNVDELAAPGGPRVASWCCHPPDHLPDADAHLAQLLQLVTDEDGFRRTGNRTPRYRLPAAA